MTNGRLRGYNLNSHPHSSSSGVRITLKSHLARFTRSPKRSARFHFTRRHRLVACRTQDMSHVPSTRKVHSSSELIPTNRRTIDSVFTRTVRFEKKKKKEILFIIFSSVWFVRRKRESIIFIYFVSHNRHTVFPGNKINDNKSIYELRKWDNGIFKIIIRNNSKRTIYNAILYYCYLLCRSRYTE